MIASHDGNRIVPYKDRKLDPNIKVRIYRNLHGEGDETFSILQNGRVVGHTNQVMLRGCKFIVQQGGRARVLRERKKYVHAFIEGFVTSSGMGTSADEDNRTDRYEVKYNPYKAGHFYEGDDTNTAYTGADVLKVRNGKVFSYYGHTRKVA